MKRLLSALFAVLAAVILLPLTSQAELKSLFINVDSNDNQLENVYEEVIRVSGIEDSYANRSNDIISLLYDTEKTSSKEILSKISDLGYGVKFKQRNNKMTSNLNVQFENMGEMSINDVRNALENHPDVVDYFINIDNKIVSIIYRENVNNKNLISNATFTNRNKFPIYKEINNRKFLNKN